MLDRNVFTALVALLGEAGKTGNDEDAKALSKTLDSDAAEFIRELADNVGFGEPEDREDDFL